MGVMGVYQRPLSICDWVSYARASARPADSAARALFLEPVKVIFQARQSYLPRPGDIS